MPEHSGSSTWISKENGANFLDDLHSLLRGLKLLHLMLPKFTLGKHLVMFRVAKQMHSAVHTNETEISQYHMLVVSLTDSCFMLSVAMPVRHV
jgi:hypothetical protein